MNNHKYKKYNPVNTQGSSLKPRKCSATQTVYIRGLKYCKNRLK